MATSNTGASCALLIALITVILSNQQVARASEHRARPKSVEPFDGRSHLLGVVRDDLPSSHEPGLGRVLQLSTYMSAKASSSMSTMFHIYRRNKVTRDIQFRAQTPSGGPLEFATDFQYNLEMMLESGFDVDKKTVIMIPGYLSDYEEQWARDAMHAWLGLYGEDVNVVVLSWADSNRCIYSQAVATTPLVARQVTVFLHYLAQLGGISLRDGQFLNRIHLIGHSLGAHICGFVGQDLGGQVGRITGLDPAGPTFDTYPIEQRLDRSDAQLVEVLHTNAGRLKFMKAISGLLMHALASSKGQHKGEENTAWFGIDENIGHVDYYANNGRTQPGCTDSLHICDHGRAGEIYVDMLHYAMYLRRTGQSSADSRQLGRLWAFRANSYEDFQAGGPFYDLCPEVAESARAPSNTTELASRFRRCSVPLLDFLTPVDELVRELRDEFHINFQPGAASETQPRFYFRTQTGVTVPESISPDDANLVADHYLLKIHLDRDATRWASSKCTLNANLYMNNDDRLSLELTEINSSHHYLALPFAHPMGPRAHGRMQELMKELGAGGAHPSEYFKMVFVQLFPRTISLGFAEMASTGAECALRVKMIEVHPVGVPSQNNLVALYGGRPILPGQKLEFLRSNVLRERLSSAAHTISSFGHINSLGVSLEAAIVSE